MTTAPDKPDDVCKHLHVSGRYGPGAFAGSIGTMKWVCDDCGEPWHGGVYELAGSLPLPVDATETVATLRTENARLLAELEEARDGVWIPVVERRPTERQTVLILAGSSHVIAYATDRGWYRVGGAAFPGRVTHWMPLPAPPTSEGE